MRAAPIIALSLFIAGCGGEPESNYNEVANSAAEAHELRADDLHNAADQSNPEAAEQLENLAAQHDQASERVPANAPAGNIANAPMPDSLQQTEKQAPGPQR